MTTEAPDNLLELMQKLSQTEAEHSPVAQPLPPDRQKAVEYGIAQFQTLAHERDELRRDAAALRERIAALEIEAEGLRAHLNDAHSQISTSNLVREQALADRIKYETLFVSIQAQLRAFAVPAAPLVRDADDAQA